VLALLSSNCLTSTLVAQSQLCIASESIAIAQFTIVQERSPWSQQETCYKPVPLPKTEGGTSIHGRQETRDRCSRDSIRYLVQFCSGIEFCEFTMNGRYSRPFDLCCGFHAERYSHPSMSRFDASNTGANETVLRSTLMAQTSATTSEEGRGYRP
jgi:hypothetical protein